jgi:hypothetical protein
MGFVGKLLQKVASCAHSVLGWTCYRLGLRSRARRHYERVLLLRGGDFGAYVHLGLLAFAQGDYAGWRREFEHARRIDPVRFTQLRHPFELFEPRLAGTNFDETGERATWRSMRPLPSPTRRQAGREDAAVDGDLLLPGGEPAEHGAEASQAAASDDFGASGLPRPLHGDDFCSPAERRRFHTLGPIGKHDVGTCDLDDLARRLSG